jgi:hypothetical protein
MGLSRRYLIEALLASGVAALAPSSARSFQSAIAAPTEEPAPTDGHVDGGRSRHNHLTAPVTLNGQGPFAFIVDTGASISCISARLAERLALPMQQTREVHTIVGVKRHPTALVDELRVGVRRQRRVTALSLPIQQTEIEGILAVYWLKGQRLTLNFVDSRIGFTASRNEASTARQVVVPARRVRGQLTLIDAELVGRPITAIIDSGSEASMCNTPLLNLLDRRQAVPSRRQLIEMITIIGEPFTGSLVYLPFLRLGGLHLGNVGVVHADTYVFKLWGLTNTPAILLGMDVLREFRAVSLDFGRSHVRFDRADDA